MRGFLLLKTGSGPWGIPLYMSLPGLFPSASCYSPLSQAGINLSFLPKPERKGGLPPVYPGVLVGGENARFCQQKRGWDIPAFLVHTPFL